MSTTVTSLQINDIVHSFCWQVRNPEREGTKDWPLILTERWPRYDADSKFGKPLHYYSPFLKFAIQNAGSRPKLTEERFNTLWLGLMAITARWVEHHFQYAASLLVKYYGVRHDFC